MHAKYHKINSVWKRDMKNRGAFIPGKFSDPEVEYLAPCRWDWSEKVHGTNIRISWLVPEGADADSPYPEPTRIIGGRTDRANIPSALLERLQELFPVEALASTFNVTSPGACVTLYGEGIGPNINDSRLSPDGPDFVLFDVRIGNWWLKREDVAAIADKFNVQFAPHAMTGTLYDAVEFVRKGFTSRLRSAAPNTPAEGLVLRPALELAARNGRRIITKIKTKDFK